MEVSESWRFLSSNGSTKYICENSSGSRNGGEGNKNTQTPSRTKGYNLKSDTVVCYCTPLLQTTDDLFFWMLGEMVSYILQHR